MISGEFIDREAIVLLPIFDDAGNPRNVEVVIDTGFTGTLSLPLHLVRNLGLKPKGKTQIFTAGERPEWVTVYTASVIWQEAQHDVDVYELTGSPLIGIDMLDGSLLTIEVRRGGLVEIELL